MLAKLKLIPKYIFLPFLFIACSNPVHRSGYMEYRIIRTGWGDKAKYGQILKLQVTQLYHNPPRKDTVLNDSRRRFPQYQQIDSGMLSNEALHIYTTLRAGDSVIFKVPADSAFKGHKFHPHHGTLITTMKVEDIFMDTTAVIFDMEMEKDLMKMREKTR